VASSRSRSEYIVYFIAFVLYFNVTDIKILSLILCMPPDDVHYVRGKMYLNT